MIRHRIAVIVLLGLTAFPVFDFLLSVPGLSFPDVAGYDRHIMEIAPTLPPSGTVGYWSDIDGTREAEQQVQQEYYLIQYALTPRVVVKGVGQEFVIVHAHPDGRLPKRPMPSANLEKVREFESGLKVFRKRKP